MTNLWPCLIRPQWGTRSSSAISIKLWTRSVYRVAKGWFQLYIHSIQDWNFLKTYQILCDITEKGVFQLCKKFYEYKEGN